MISMSNAEILKTWNENLTEDNSWKDTNSYFKSKGITKIRSCKNKPGYFDIQTINGQTCYGIKFKVEK